MMVFQPVGSRGFPTTEPDLMLVRVVFVRIVPARVAPVRLTFDKLAVPRSAFVKFAPGPTM